MKRGVREIFGKNFSRLGFIKLVYKLQKPQTLYKKVIC